MLVHKEMIKRAFEIFNLFPKNPNKLIELSESFNYQYGEESVDIEYREVVYESVRLNVRRFGELVKERKIIESVDPITGEQINVSSYEVTFNRCFDDFGLDEFTKELKIESLKIATEITNFLIPYFLSNGKDKKKIPLLVNLWSDVATPILRNEWNIK